MRCKSQSLVKHPSSSSTIYIHRGSLKWPNLSRFKSKRLTRARHKQPPLSSRQHESKKRQRTLREIKHNKTCQMTKKRANLMVIVTRFSRDPLPANQQLPVAVLIAPFCNCLASPSKRSARRIKKRSCLSTSMTHSQVERIQAGCRPMEATKAVRISRSCA